MDALKKSIKFLDCIEPNNEYIEQQYERMKASKLHINEQLGLDEGNDFRAIIPFSITNEIFKEAYPKTYATIEMATEGKEFNLVENWINNPKKQKLSKFLSKKMDKKYGNLVDEIRNGEISGIFDIIKPKNIVISTNMYDFFTSASNASFRSCYTLDGCHFNGNIAYMEDPWSFMIYTYSKDKYKKIGRSWGYLLEDSMFLTSKIYGSMYEVEMGTAVKYIHDCMNSNGNWKANEIDYENYCNARPYEDAMVPVYFDYDGIIVHHTKEVIDCNELPMLEFRSETKCMKCGEWCSTGYYGLCEDCSEEIKRCRFCNDIYHINKLHDKRNRVCKTCYKKHYSKCGCCGTEGYTDNMSTINGKLVCGECIRKSYRRCNCCNKYHLNKECNPINGMYYCKKCLETIFVCEKCNGVVINTNKDEIPINDNRKLCGNCYFIETGNIFKLAHSWECYIQNSHGKVELLFNNETRDINVKYVYKNEGTTNENEFTVLLTQEDVRGSNPFLGNYINIGMSFKQTVEDIIYNGLGFHDNRYDIQPEEPVYSRNRVYIPNDGYVGGVNMEEVVPDNLINDGYITNFNSVWVDEARVQVPQPEEVNPAPIQGEALADDEEVTQGDIRVGANSFIDYNYSQHGLPELDTQEEAVQEAALREVINNEIIASREVATNDVEITDVVEHAVYDEEFRLPITGITFTTGNQVHRI